MPPSPQAILIAGPNGACKTTLARQLVPLGLPGARFFNADEIAREAAFAGPIASGREMLRRLDEAVTGNADFVLETTLASRRYLRAIPTWEAHGYTVGLHFIELPSANYAVARVAKRVAAGGHDIPEADIRRRFGRGLRLFHAAYKPVVDHWRYWRSTEGGIDLADRSDP